MSCRKIKKIKIESWQDLNDQLRALSALYATHPSECPLIPEKVHSGPVIKPNDDFKMVCEVQNGICKTN